MTFILFTSFYHQTQVNISYCLLTTSLAERQTEGAAGVECCPAPPTYQSFDFLGYPRPFYRRSLACYRQVEQSDTDDEN